MSEILGTYPPEMVLTVVNAGATVVLVLVTGFYVWLTRGVVIATQEQASAMQDSLAVMEEQLALQRTQWEHKEFELFLESKRSLRGLSDLSDRLLARVATLPDLPKTSLPGLRGGTVLWERHEVEMLRELSSQNGGQVESFGLEAAGHLDWLFDTVSKHMGSGRGGRSVRHPATILFGVDYFERVNAAKAALESLKATIGTIVQLLENRSPPRSVGAPREQGIDGGDLPGPGS